MKIKLIVLLSIFLGIAFLAVNFSMDKRSLSGKFSANEIRQVKFGMNLEEVLNILGRPYKIEALAGLHDFNCTQPNTQLIKDIDEDSDIREIVNEKFSVTDFCCEGNREDLSHKRVTLEYTKPKDFSRHYPMLWVHLDSNFQVESVYAKQYDGFLGLDDPCIYSLNQESVSENQELFEKNFKQY